MPAHALASESASRGMTLCDVVYRLVEAGAVARAVQAALQLGRDEGHAVRLAAARAGGYLSLAELQGGVPADAALAPLVPLFVCLLGTDQSSDVQRQQLHVRAPRVAVT